MMPLFFEYLVPRATHFSPLKLGLRGQLKILLIIGTTIGSYWSSQTGFSGFFLLQNSPDHGEKKRDGARTKKFSNKNLRFLCL